MSVIEEETCVRGDAIRVHTAPDGKIAGLNTKLSSQAGSNSLAVMLLEAI